MAEISSNEERQRAEKGSPFDPTSASGGGHLDPNHSPNGTWSPEGARLGRSARPGKAISSKHFTLYAGFASTKKQGLRLAFGVRAGSSAVRNRAKRLARETFRLNRHKLPDGITIVITTKGGIATLPRRAIRDQLTELFDRARTLSPPQALGVTSTR